jgi:Arm domain-containing DNA-binding protein
MPRPRLDGTPAKAANKRTLSDAFLRAVKPNPERVTMVWDNKLRGLVLAVQPTGHRSWKAAYSRHSRPRWYHIGSADAIGLADARKLARRIMFQVAEGKDPHADRVAERGHGTFAELAERYLTEYAQKHNKSWRQADFLVRKYLLPRWGQANQHHAPRCRGHACIHRKTGAGQSGHRGGKCDILMSGKEGDHRH